MAAWHLDWMLENHTREKAPVPLKVAIAVEGLFVLSQAVRGGHVIAGVLATAALVALWNMKRWPVVLLGLFMAGNAVLVIPHYVATSPRSLPLTLVFAVLIAVIPNIALVAGALYWRRMTWT